MKLIPVPQVSYGEIEVSLSGNTFNITYRFNERSDRWKIDIYDSEGAAVAKGLTILEEFSPTAHLTLPNFPEGILFVGTNRNTPELCGLNNFGINKTYEFVYSTIAELEEE